MALVRLIEWDPNGDPSSGHFSYDEVVSIRRYRPKRSKKKGADKTADKLPDLTRIVLENDDIPMIVEGLPDDIRQLVDENRWS